MRATTFLSHSDATDLNDKLGEVIGLTQAVRLMVRQVVTRVELGVEVEVAQLLERFGAELGEVQRRCDSLVATQSGFKQSRITARAREIKASVASPGRERAGTGEMLTALALVAQDALVRWRELAALVSVAPPTPMTNLVSGAILLHEDHVRELARHLR